MLDNLDSKQKKILIIVGIIVGILVIWFIYNKEDKDVANINEEILAEENETEDEKIEETNEIIIHITGAINEPGIKRLKEGSRIEDAIEMAGGLTEDADISNVNLAYVLDDGIKIKIPSSIDTQDPEESEIITEEPGENVIENIASSAKNTFTKININKATEEELTNLPGIGEEIASKIIEYREQNGKFEDTEQIKNVNGIGER